MTRTDMVLGELEVAGKPVVEVLNKVDRLPVTEREALGTGDLAVAVSGRTGEGLPGLLAAIDRSLTADPLVDGSFRIPQADGALVAALEAGAVIHTRRFEGNLLFLEVTGPASLLGRLRRFRVQRPGAPSEYRQSVRSSNAG